MKKSILTVALILVATITFAQDLTSKKGENFLPEAGDWAIGIDAVPLLNYLGNTFGKDADNMYARNIWTPSNPNLVITGKYFKTEKFAYRGGIRLGFGSEKGKKMVRDRQVALSLINPWPETQAEVENSAKYNNTNIGLTLGAEWRKGNTRLQGFYGAEIGILVNSSSVKYTYGNALAGSIAPVPVDVTYDDNLDGDNLDMTMDGEGLMRTTRILTNKSGLKFSLGLRAFIGAEYFMIPKLSIGGELGWGLGFNIHGKSTLTEETVGLKYGATETTVETITTEGIKYTSFGMDNSIVNPLFGPVGRLTLTFHF